MPVEEQSNKERQQRAITEIFQSKKGTKIYRITLPSLAEVAVPSFNDGTYQKASGRYTASQLFLSGFRDFLTPWVIRTPDYDGVVDVGPAVTIPALFRNLRTLGIGEGEDGSARSLYVLLTHIHIDHAGGIGDFLKAFPHGKVVVHPSGVRHLLEPQQLWTGTVKTLGELAYAYGAIKPIAEENLFIPRQEKQRQTAQTAETTQTAETGPHWNGLDELSRGLSIIPTLGHASHHQSYLFTEGEERILFLGEAGGVYLPRYERSQYDMPEYGKPEYEGSKCDQSDEYLRPATPPRLFYDVFIQSLKSLVELEPTLLLYGHFGYSNKRELLSWELEQLNLWKGVVLETLADEPEMNEFGDASDDAGKAGNRDESQLISTLFEKLLARDPRLKGFGLFAEDVGLREKYFLENSIKGFVSALR